MNEARIEALEEVVRRLHDAWKSRQDRFSLQGPGVADAFFDAVNRNALKPACRWCSSLGHEECTEECLYGPDRRVES